MVACGTLTKFKTGDEAFERKHYSTAIELYQKELSHVKSKKTAAHKLFLIAEAYRKMDLPQKSVKWFEKSIDAGAKKIEIHLVNNGLELISLKDNGTGIGFEDLPLAFARHATSKIEKFEDLYRCQSFGFRGEALASLASVAKVKIKAARNFPHTKVAGGLGKE